MIRALAPARWCAGASLLEVLAAMSLLAVSLLGAAAAQLTALRDANEQTHRVRGAWLAASIIEAMRLPGHSSSLLARSHQFAGAALPGARVAIVGDAADMRAVTVHWRDAPNAWAPQPTIGDDPCGLAQPDVFGPCVSLPLVTAR